MSVYRSYHSSQGETFEKETSLLSGGARGDAHVASKNRWVATQLGALEHGDVACVAISRDKSRARARARAMVVVIISDEISTVGNRGGVSR